MRRECGEFHVDRRIQQRPISFDRAEPAGYASVSLGRFFSSSSYGPARPNARFVTAPAVTDRISDTVSAWRCHPVRRAMAIANPAAAASTASGKKIDLVALRGKAGARDKQHDRERK